MLRRFSVVAASIAVTAGASWAALPAPADAESVSVPDPVLHYTFNDLTLGSTLAAGSAITDTGTRASVTNGTVQRATATAVAGVTGAAGDVALHLPGGTSSSTTASYVTLPSDILSSSDTAVTVTAWAKWEGNANGNCQWPFALGTAQASNMYVTTSCTGTYGAVSDGTEQRVASGGANLATGVWTQIALVYDVANHTLSYYVNGALKPVVSGATGNKLNPVTGLTTTINATLGGGQLGKSFYGDPYYGGALDDVEVFNSALTPDQLKTLGASDFQAIVNGDSVSLGDTSAVTSNLTLPATGAQGSAVTWASSDPAVVSTTGLVTRPSASAGDASLTLTPTYSLGGQSHTGTPIDVTVLAKATDSTTVPTDGLIADYDFSDTSGTTLTNTAATGAADDATVQGTPAWGTGQMSFTGSNYVKLPDNLQAGQTAATVTVEAKPDATSLSHNNFLWNLGGTGNTAANSGTGQFFVQTNGHRTAITKTNYSGEQNAPAANPFVADQWQSITTTIAPNGDGTSTLTLYVDGTQAAQLATSTTNLADLTTLTNNLIGASAYSADAKFTGAISSFRLYGRALTAGEVQQVANADTKAVADETLAGIDLGDLSAVADDLSLPTSGGITWATSNAAVIGADGTVHQAATAQQATLTATVSVRGETATRTFDVTVAAEADTTAPVLSSATLSPAAPASGWYVTAPSVTTTATDDSGVAPTIQVQIGSGSWTTYTGGALTGLAQGSNTVSVRAVDGSNNQSTATPLTVKYDTVAPVSTATSNNTARTVTITATDATSGVASTQYSLDGGTTWHTYGSPVTVGDAATTVSYRSTDTAGNVGATGSIVVPAAVPSGDQALTATPTPVIAGTAQVGSALSVSAGTWGPAPVALSYQWLRSGVAVPGATGTTYPVTPADLGATISVEVTGTKSGYTSVSKVSAVTGPVAAGTLATHKPKLKGHAKVGKKLKAKAGSWGPAPVTLTYQWYRSGKKIKGATKATYRLEHADHGKRITVKVTGSEPGYATVMLASKRTAKVH